MIFTMVLGVLLVLCIIDVVYCHLSFASVSI